MINILKRLVAPPLSSPALVKAEDDEAESLRALETLAALSTVVGVPLSPPTKQSHEEIAPEAESTSAADATPEVEPQPQGAWYAAEFEQPKKKELLAEPAACPPYTDPSSVLIVDQGSLEYELDTTSSFTSLLSFDDDGEEPRQGSKIRFRPTVCVVEIPSHRDMDPEVVESVWTSSEVVHKNGRRNTMEYNHDGRNWKNVLEEHEMIYDPASGEHIHPATWEDMEFERERLAWEQQRREVERQRRQQEQERIRLAMEEAERQERMRSEPTAKKTKGRRRRQRQTSPKRSPRTSPRTSPRNALARKRSPLVTPSASLTRFADT